MKKNLSRIAQTALLVIGLVPLTTSAKDLAELKLLYIGPERSAAFVDFLRPKVARIETSSRANFQASDARNFDVVLLDWPQSGNGEDFPPKTSPLGARDAWSKPTVLLGSAGLNLAVVWQLKGGIGCTCMDPLAYDLREHPIFERPFRIDRNSMISIPTPKDFRAEIKASNIMVLPLTDDTKKGWKAGWCTYSYDFGSNPEVELFSGGVNHKTPTAAGLWRQGNLLHFGFEQSPEEMNENGRRLLLNSIVYISRFTQDRPIAITPSPFAGPVARLRSTPARWLRNPDYGIQMTESIVTPNVWEQVSPLSRAQKAEWFDRNERYLHPDATQKLELDSDLVALGVAFDQPEFFDRTIADLRANGTAAERAKRLLERYAPCGPKSGSPDQWANWWIENKPFAFASDAGDYRWYIDPLAQQRGKPSRELRGSSRSDAIGAGHGK
ncbi:MAG: hypothetical protein J0M24_16230 [Verrucomicrobia bacterium]|nr:hypothetical protein [Verrucomicrobiota bacterium]